MAAFFEGFVDELIQFDFCKQMQTQRIDQIWTGAICTWPFAVVP